MAPHRTVRAQRRPGDVDRIAVSPRETSLYHFVKRITLADGTSLPNDALVHGLRHHLGVQLAIRGVAPATLQQLVGHTDPRTTALYTRRASRNVVNGLDDAGWLADAEGVILNY